MGLSLGHHRRRGYVVELRPLVSRDIRETRLKAVDCFSHKVLKFGHVVVPHCVRHEEVVNQGVGISSTEVTYTLGLIEVYLDLEFFLVVVKIWLLRLAVVATNEHLVKCYKETR